MNTPTNDFEIAPNFEVSKWKAIDIQGTQWSSEWGKAINVFENRIKVRFLDQIDALIKNDDKATEGFCGFAIVALDCLLIETLNQFYEGIDETPRNNHSNAFHAVFQRSAKLKDVFNSEEKTRVFYDQIRCGLLHQAQTKGNSKINRKIQSVIEWCNLVKPKQGLIVNPREFHKCVKEIYSEYVEQLKTDATLRSRFRTKMNLIAGII